MNFSPATGHKLQHLPAMAFDLYTGSPSRQWLWMQCSVRSSPLLACLLHLIDALGCVKGLGQELAH